MTTWHGIRKVEQLPERKFNDLNKLFKSVCNNFTGHEHVSSFQFIHGSWWYLVNGSWQCESTLEVVN